MLTLKLCYVRFSYFLVFEEKETCIERAKSAKDPKV